MTSQTTSEPTTLPRRTRQNSSGTRTRPPVGPAHHRDLPPLPVEPGDLSAAVRALLRIRPDLAHPARSPNSGGTAPVSVLIADLVASLSEVHRLALSIGADREAADIAALITTLRTTP